MSPVLLVGYQISGLIDGETAVGDDDRTGDVTRFIGSEVQNGRRLFFRSRVAALQGLGLAGEWLDAFCCFTTLSDFLIGCSPS